MDKILTSIAHPHDQFFRDVMSDLRIAREFFALHLPNKILSEIDLRTLELEPSSYFKITDTLSELDKVGYRNFVSSVLQYALERGEIEDEALFF